MMFGTFTMLSSMHIDMGTEDDSKTDAEDALQCCQSRCARNASRFTGMFTERWACLDYVVPCYCLLVS